MMKGIINKIIDFSCVDGPGNRSVIFLQGCNFNCKYCHNPETINFCKSCMLCVRHCKHEALTVVQGKVSYDEKHCQQCDACIKHCPYESSPKTVEMSPQEVMDRVNNNRPYIRGITVSGGECTLQIEFLTQLLRQAKQENLSTLIDSNGSYDFKKTPELLKWTDGVMLDIKATHEVAHQELTGVSVAQVLENAVFLAQQGKLYELRTVIVRENQKPEEIIGDLAKGLGQVIKLKDIRYKLIKYRPIGVREKYKEILHSPTEESMTALKAYAQQVGFGEIIII